MQHVHVEDIRPDRVYATGVIQPYPVGMDPAEIARKTIDGFVRFIRPAGPAVQAEMQPEEVAAAAKRLADALRQGKVTRGYVDDRLRRAAQYIIEGRTFQIRAAGRMVLVRPSSTASPVVSNPANSVVAR